MQKIAVISPSRTLTTKISEILHRRSLSFKIVQAGQEEAPLEAQKLVQEGVRVIISRGNTAHMLRGILSIPVVEVQHTFFDCYGCYLEALKVSDKVAFLATSEGYLKTLNKCRELMPKAIIYPLDPLAGADYTGRKLDELAAMGVDAAIGGLSLEQEVTDRGIAYIMTSTDEDAVCDAIDEALHLMDIEEERAKKEKELQGRYETIQAILNCAAEGILHINNQGIIMAINETAEKLLRPLGCGRDIYSLVKTERLSPVLQDGELLRGEIISYRENPLLMNINPIRVGKRITGAVITLQKQTEIQSMEQKIRHRLLMKGHVSDKTFEDIIGTSDAIERVKKLAAKFAAVDSTVLIAGDTGTGKELFAQSIHNASARKSAPFVAINCASFSPGVLESELFGYVKGAFTGALNEGKPGVFELAHNGTIFLDEISETPPDVQLKLLRVIQERKVIRIGDDKITHVNVRIITATNKDLNRLVEVGKFREDFYYRICVLKLNLPSLSERKEDIPLLIRHFLAHSNFSGHRITDGVVAELSGRSFKGNVRQLGNVVERLAVMCDDKLIDETTLRCAEESEWFEQVELLEKGTVIETIGESGIWTEKELIREVLRQNKGKKSSAAAQLGISTTTLWRKMKEISEAEPHYFDLAKYGQSNNK